MRFVVTEGDRVCQDWASGGEEACWRATTGVWPLARGSGKGEGGQQHELGGQTAALCVEELDENVTSESSPFSSVPSSSQTGRQHKTSPQHRQQPTADGHRVCQASRPFCVNAVVLVQISPSSLPGLMCAFDEYRQFPETHRQLRPRPSAETQPCHLPWFSAERPDSHNLRRFSVCTVPVTVVNVS